MNRTEREERKGSRVGLYTTIIVHLGILLVLLTFSFKKQSSLHDLFVIDFTKDKPTPEEEKEMEDLAKKVAELKMTADQMKAESERLKQENFKKDVSQELDKMIEAAPDVRVRNVARDAGGRLADDRNTDTRQLYRDAKDLQSRLDATKKDAIRQDEKVADYNAKTSGRRKSSASQDDGPGYTGPSVLSYTLKGRKGHYLEVPAYKWYGAGDVTVQISVDRTGRVVDAKVVPEKSTNDTNLYALAVEAALNSLFTPLSSAPNPQTGTIVYRFISQ